jgi:hypothetical protein
MPLPPDVETDDDPAERHAERLRARDVRRRDVIDVAERPAKSAETWGLVQ